MGTYSVISHTADIGISVVADDFADLFVTATRAMFEVMYGPAEGRSSLSRHIEASGDSASELLWDWLSAVLGWAEADGAAYFDADVVVAGAASGTVRGPVSTGLELAGPPIKAVTLHQLRVESKDGVWMAEVIFDV